LQTLRWSKPDSNSRSLWRGKLLPAKVKGPEVDQGGLKKASPCRCGTNGSNPSPSSAESGTNRRRRVRGRCSLLGSCFARSLDDGRYRTVISSREHTRVQKFPLRRRSRDACATRLAAELLDPMRHLELIRVCRLLPAAEAPDQMVAAVRELGVAGGARARVGAPLPIRSSSSGCGSAPGRRSRPQYSAAPAPRR